MATDWRVADTVELTDELAARRARASAPVPCLTILWHPDASRVGERAPIDRDGRGTALSRLSPSFAARASSAARPLETPFVSRHETWITAVTGHELEVSSTGPDAGLRVGGVPLSGPRRIEADELREGVVIEIGKHVALLLHLAAWPRAPVPETWGMAGSSDGLSAVLQAVSRVAAASAPVLLVGESGVGKELVARALHAASARREHALVSVNIAGIPAEIAAAELFGHVEGAYTGARRPRTGLFVDADGGTLFLDEIGAASVELQAMLLRVIEDGEVRPLGAAEPRRVDVRVVAATDEDLAAGVAAGRFRAPLLHRLSAYRIDVPPLRERREDVAVLLGTFLRRELAQVGRESLLAPDPVVTRGREAWFPVGMLRPLLAYGWPGNARQLHNFARRLVLQYGESAAIDADAAIHELQGAEELPAGEPEGTTSEDLLAALEATGWSIAAVARQLGLSRSAVYRLIDGMPEVRRAKDVPEDELRRCLAACGGDLEMVARQLRVSERGLKLRMRQLGSSPR